MYDSIKSCYVCNNLQVSPIQNSPQRNRTHSVMKKLVPPLLSAEAPDATGPSLSGGQTPSPGRRVSGLGGPELVRPMLLLQLRPSIS